MSNTPSDSTHTITFKTCNFPSLYVRSDCADITGAVLDIRLDQLKQQLFIMSFKKVHADRQRV